MKKTTLFIALYAALVGVSAQPASPTDAPATTVRKGESITLNFSNADIEAVARAIATLTGRNVVVDPRVKGTISLVTEKPISPALAYNQFLAMLRLQGFTVVESGGLDKIVPEADAKLQGGAVLEGKPAGNSQIMTQIFKLNFENANNLVPILRPLISPNNTINVNPSNNSLVITDYGDNLRRMAQIIAAMDVSNATDIEIITLQHAIASDLVPLVQRLLDSSSSGATVNPTGGAGDASFKTTVIAEPRSNTVVIRAANPARLALAKSLITKLDQPSSKNPTGNIYVVYLKNAEASKLAVTLRAALASGSSSTATTPQAGTPSATTTPTSNTATPQSSTGGQIQADAATNSLIITAPEPQYRQIRAVIDQLDQRRAQVYVESLIAEVNADKAAEFGVQWQSALGQNGDTNVGFLGTNFSIGGTNIVDLAVRAATGAGTVLPSSGINIGIGHQTNGVYVLGALARFIQSNGAGNVLSTPNLVTLDNEEAKIVIGKNVPFVTGQYTNTGSTSTGTVNPFQTYERKDVGLTLRVKPQISENGTVRLTVFQEVSSIAPESVNAVSGPTTNKRSIETSVLVNDGSIIVLGGLLTDEFANNQEKVPGLGDLPWIGNLFKSETRSRKKTNLMLFLRPVVMRDAAATDTLSQTRYDQMRALQVDSQAPQTGIPPANEAAVLP